jgi:NTE family protein
VATAAASNRTVVFVEGGRAGRPPLRGTLPPSNRIKAIDYVAAHIGVDHVLASSAIPFVFPPVRVAEPDAPGRWFIDGGTRLNTPLKPALSLGVDRVVIVASDSAERGLLDPVTADEPPDMGAALLHLIQTAVSDRLIEDVWRLAEINELVHTGSAKRVYPYRFVGPRADGELGHLAAEVLERKYRGPFSFFSDYSLLRRLLGGRSPQHAELISYMFFDPDFIEASIELGQLRARERMNERWRKGPLMTG